jgi:predicted HNH restriction endonuclease
MKSVVIAENDESAWHDVTGSMYHFPSRYLKFLTPGTRVIYYKGKLKNPKYRELRMTSDPHYFASARIGKILVDKESKKNYYAQIIGFVPFSKPVGIREGEVTFEKIPMSRRSNYWRDGVRPIDMSIYSAIVGRGLQPGGQGGDRAETSDLEQGLTSSLESAAEGEKTKRYITTYERDPRLRTAAIKIHGAKCVACGFDFEATYGPHGAGYIHVHHVCPVSSFGGRKKVDPKTDLTVLCANCHSMVHRFKEKSLSIAALRGLVSSAREKRRSE